jgi:hypothetical protein
MGACFKTLFFLVEISELPILAGQIALFLADFPILRWVPSFFWVPWGFFWVPWVPGSPSELQRAAARRDKRGASRGSLGKTSLPSEETPTPNPVKPMRSQSAPSVVWHREPP